MSESGQDAFLEVQVWSDDPPECSGVVGRPSQISLSGGTPFRMSGSGRETLPDVPERWEVLPDVREW